MILLEEFFLCGNALKEKHQYDFEMKKENTGRGDLSSQRPAPGAFLSCLDWGFGKDTWVR